MVTVRLQAEEIWVCGRCGWRTSDPHFNGQPSAPGMGERALEHLRAVHNRNDRWEERGKLERQLPIIVNPIEILTSGEGPQLTVRPSSIDEVTEYAVELHPPLKKWWQFWKAT